MARGTATHAQSSPATTTLPKVEYELSTDDVFKLPAGVHENQPRTFGYNDFSEFRRPEYYIRHVEPLESELAKTVEYDMDEQDDEWLKVVNVDRKKEQMDSVSTEAFEIIMDRLEKEWFDLTKNIPKADFAMPSEDSTCAICDDSEGENSNAIVFCDGYCYGVPYIPEGQWLCRKCTVSPENPVSCFLCPNEGGAFKQTVHGEWVHLLCAIWIPETRVANDVFMEPITGADRISKQRWKLRCSVCDIREGACIQCTKPSCFIAFHATCARKEKLLMPMKSAQGAEPASLMCYCDKHLPQEQQDARAAALEAEEHQERPHHQLATKSARAYAKTYRPGPPLVPSIIVNRILAYIARIRIRKKQDFIYQICRYWSLKREARRGAPLLKRLHLEPWTANGGTKVLSNEEKLMRLEQLQRLRQDLVVLKDLTDLVRKREMRKLRQAEVTYEVMAQAIFPHYGPLRHAFERIMVFDRHDHFKNPVLRHEVPDYFDIIKHPMCWDDIDAKLDQHKYWDLQSFLDDIHLVLDNAILYNKKESVFQKSALHIKRSSRGILAELENLRCVHEQPPPQPQGHIRNEEEEEEEIPNSAVDPPLQSIGDLEPYMELLELLIATDEIKDDLNIELNDTPIASLFTYEFATVKPTPLEPTPDEQHPSPIPRAAKPRKGKPKKERKTAVKSTKKAEAERSRREVAASGSTSVNQQEGEAENVEEIEKASDRRASLDSSGFRLPRTRGGLAAAAAFEAEARGLTSSPSSSAAPSLPPEVSPAETKPTSKSKRRPTIPIVGQPSIPRVVSAVDNRDSFSMFNAGWILPPDQKRGGRAPASQQSLPPPRKRQKLDHPNSRLSVVSTAASDNQTLPKSLPPFSDPPEAKHQPENEADDAMDVDYPVHEEQEVPQGPSRGVSPRDSEDEIDGAHNVFTQPDGVVVIEELETPAIRREKYRRRKAEKQNQAASDPSLPGPSQVKPTSTSAEDDEQDAVGDVDESELSELSEEDNQETDADDEEQQPEEVSVSIRSKARPPKKSSRPTRAGKYEQFEDYTIVWAKADSFPWWPAVVYSDTNDQVPPNIVEANRQKRQKRKIKLFIIQFYDKQNSWQSVTRDKLMLLGADKKLDQELLGTTTKQKWKSSTQKADCREAYRQACTDMEAGNVSGTADASEGEGASEEG